MLNRKSWKYMSIEEKLDDLNRRDKVDTFCIITLDITFLIFLILMVVVFYLGG